MENAPAAAPPAQRRTLFEAVAASTIGTTIEWYDFFLYGTAAAIVFPHLFFRAVDPFTARLLSFGTFSFGFLARPLGGVLFGHFGDRIGRKSTLVATLLLMGVSTFLVGFLPTYDRIGVAAPLILTFLRFAQGVGVGGEWGGAVLLALEYGHHGRRGFYASWPQAGVPLGLLTSTGVVALLEWLMPPDAFLAWGWRIPFFLSGLLIALGLLIRVRILETPLFTRLQEKQQLARAPVAEAIRFHWRDILLAAGARLNEQSSFYLFSVYVISYGTAVLGMSDRLFVRAVSAAAAFEFFTIPLYGLLSDRVTRRHTYALGCAVLAVFAFPYFALLGTRAEAGIYLAVILSLAGGHAMLYSVQGALIPELFATRLRYTGASLGYQLAAPISGLAPLVAVTVDRAFPHQSWPLALYIILLSAVSLACVRMLAETSGRTLH